MVTVKLTESSQLGGRYVIEGLEGRTEITRNDSASIPLRRAIVALSDENLMFEFDEADREDLLNLSEKLLAIGLKEVGKESGTAQDLCDILLPKKVAPKPKSKPKPKKTSTTAKKSALSED